MHDNVEIICKYFKCRKKFIVSYKNRNRRFCSLNCVTAYRNTIITPWNKGKTKEQDERIMKYSLKIGASISGDNNGMKQIEARNKVSKSRKKMYENKDERRKTAELTKKAWENGKFDGVKVGRCKWYDYKEYKVQGTWELAFIKWLDNNNLKFTCHRGRLSYFDDNGYEKSFYPDFYVYDWNSYVDVKSDYFYNINKNKIDNILKHNKNVKILLKEDLIKLGVFDENCKTKEN